MKMGENGTRQQAETPLESWKEIGAYLLRDARTARCWEKEEGLPVHRHVHQGRSSVYAYPSEIDAWKLTRRVAREPAPARPWWQTLAIGFTTSLCLDGRQRDPATGRLGTAREAGSPPDLDRSRCGR